MSMPHAGHDTELAEAVAEAPDLPSTRRAAQLRWLLIAAALATLAFLASRDPLLGLLGLIGFGGAFVSGLVGVGGAIVLIPLLLYLPPALGFAELDIRTVAAITIVQVTVAGVVGLVGHRRWIDRGLVTAIAASMAIASFAGGLASAFVEPVVLEATFATMAAAAAVVTLVLRRRTAPVLAGRLVFNRPAAGGVGGVIGFLAGMVGAGGAFLLMPAMLFGLRVPMRAAVGASLASVAVSAAAGLLGKAVTGQVDWVLAAGLVAGALPGTLAGTLASHRMRVEHLATVLGVIIGLVAVRMWAGVLT